MREQHSSSIEKIGIGLACSVETFRGCTIQLVKKTSGLKFLPKLQLKFPKALDKLVEHLIKNPNDKTWHDSVIEIWQNQSNWECLYHAPEEE